MHGLNEGHIAPYTDIEHLEQDDDGLWVGKIQELGKYHGCYVLAPCPARSPVDMLLNNDYVR